MTDLTILRPSQPDYESAVEALRLTLAGGELKSEGSSDEASVSEIVRDILRQVKEGGDEAAARLASKLDRASLSASTLRVSAEQLEAAHRAAEPQFLELMRRTAKNIEEYQRQIRWSSPSPLKRVGSELGVRYLPLDRVAVYVPGGKALYPSTILMTVVPAKVAGVKEVVMVSPPTGGDLDPMAMALAWELGVTEVYRLGGAVGLAAVAFGTQSIKPVDMIVGPGNAFVGEAKRQLFGTVGIDSIAGPSEVFIVADNCADPAWLAADLLAQAEHNPGSAILATPDESLAEEVLCQVEIQLQTLSRSEAARHSLRNYGAVIVTEDLSAACRLANRFATEHLQIITRRDEDCLSQIRSAGAVFLGAHTPVPLGDYIAGPSHVLPTGGTSRFSAPLSCNQFLKATSILRYDSQGLASHGPDAIAFATREGLTAHARAVSIRIGPSESEPSSEGFD